MGETTLQEKLISYLRDTHAMEMNVLQMLGSMIATTDDPEMKEALERHKGETENHERSIRECLEAHNETPAVTKDVPAVLGAMAKGLYDAIRGDKAGKNARDGFVTEHLEIAAYELLERLAERAGDQKTVQVARQNRSDEERMASFIEANWDKVLDMSLQEAGIAV